MSEKGRDAARVTPLYSHSVAGLEGPGRPFRPSIDSLWPVVPRGFAASRTLGLTSMGVRPTEGEGLQGEDAHLRDFAKPSTIAFGRSTVSTGFSLFVAGKGVGVACKPETRPISRAVRFPFFIQLSYHARR